MNLEPNDTRQWYAYFKEKELGPFSETDLKAKIKSGELTHEAYVFTEGMTDWVLAKEIAVLNDEGGTNTSEVAAPASPLVPEGTAPTAQNPNALGASPSGGLSAAPVAAKKGGLAVAESSKNKLGSGADASGKATTKSVEKKIKKSPSKLRPLLILVLVLAVIGYGVMQLGSGLINKIPFLSGEPDPTELLDDVDGKAGENVLQEDPNAVATPEPPPRKVWSWAELFKFSTSPAPKEGRIALRKDLIKQPFPIVMGAIANSENINNVHIYIYPDTEKNLSAFPRVIRLNVPVIDGLFAFGPLMSKGKRLAPGIYKMKFKIKDEIHNSSVELGVWPKNQAAIDKIKAEATNIKNQIALTEQNHVKEQLASSKDLAQKIVKIRPMAMQRMKQRSVWIKESEIWRMQFNSIVEKQTQVLQNPVLFSDIQTKLLDLMGDLLKYEAALDAYSRGGLKLLKTRVSKTLGELWEELESKMSKLEGLIMVMNTDLSTKEIQLDEKLLEEQLLSLEK